MAFNQAIQFIEDRSDAACRIVYVGLAEVLEYARGCIPHSLYPPVLKGIHRAEKGGHTGWYVPLSPELPRQRPEFSPS